MQPDVTAACQYAFDFLKNGLSADLTYHNVGHTFDDVLPNALRMAALADVNEADQLLLRTAAAFHDVGYVRQIHDHEEVGVEISAEILPTFNYSPAQIAQIHQMIRATKVPQSPKNLLDQLLCDADLDVLGRPEFVQRNHDLRDEAYALGDKSTLLQWYEGQHRFVSGHNYHTEVARGTRDAGKRENLAKLDAWMLNLRLSAFMPRDLRERALQGQPLTPDESLGERNGTALFADIAGFTKLTETLLAQYGAERGAEAVLQAINPLYDAIIPTLYDYNGSVIDLHGDTVNSVIGFAGDSITCWLDGEDAAERAVACALAMQRAMADQTVTFVDGSQQQMAIKIGIASGKVRRMLVGDPAHGLYDVLAGKTVATMATAAELADSAEIIICPETAAQLADRLTILPLPDRYCRVEDVYGHFSAQVTAHPYKPEPNRTIPREVASQWVLEPVADRLAGGGFLAELRPAAALFMRFHGIDYDNDPESGSKLDRLIRWTQNIFQQTHGYLIQLSVGDKGSYLYASFGAPLAFAGNARRAATAALSLRKAAQLFDFIDAVEIGISQGRMWTGAYGSQSRSTYGVISRATNLAARLMQAANANQILVHESVAAELHEFELNRIADQTAKGFDKPQATWELLAMSAGNALLPRFNRPLIGRDSALGFLMGEWQTVVAGQGQAIATIGEAGIGKSHLAATFARDLQTFGGRIFWAQGDQTRRDLFYDVWRQLIVGLFELTPLELALEPDEMLAWLGQSIAGGHFADDERLPLLGDLLGVPLPDNEATAAFEPAVRRESLFALITALLAEYAQSPLCLVLDDAHLLDEASRALLLRVLQSMSEWSLLLLLVRRPLEDDAAAWQDAFDQTLLQTVDIDALSGSALSVLVDHQLGATPSQLLSGLVERQTHGNPFYLESLVETLRDDGKIVLRSAENGSGFWDVADELLERLRATDSVRLQSGDWTLAPEADLASLRLGLPDSVHRSVLTRIDRLPEATKLVLKLASVIGQQFDTDLLTASHPQGISAEALYPHLNHLAERNMIRPLGDNLYQFQHHATQEVTYNTLLFAQRQGLHRQVMQALKVTRPDDDVAIAQHSFEAQEWEMALPYLTRLGERAQQLYANHQSVAYYGRVLTCLKSTTGDDATLRIRDVNLALGESLIHLGRYAEALEHLDDARELSQDADEAQRLARACRWTARAHELQGDYPAAIGWLGKGMAADQQRSRESAELYLIAGLIESHRGNYDAAQELCDSAIKMAQTFDAPAILGRSWNLAGILALYRGQNDRAIEHFGVAYQTYRDCNDRRGEALALNQLANALFDRGDWQQADTHYQRARTIFVETGDIYNRLLVDNNLGGIARNQKRLADALAFYDAALLSLEQIGGSAYAKGALHLNRGTTLTLLGRTEEASAEMKMSRALLESAGVRVLMPELTRNEALVAMVKGDLPKAVQLADAAIDLASELEMRAEQGHAMRVRGRIALGNDELAQARDLLEGSLAIMQESADTFGIGETLFQLAELHEALEEPERANEFSQQALAIYTQLGVE